MDWKRRLRAGALAVSLIVLVLVIIRWSVDLPDDQLGLFSDFGAFILALVALLAEVWFRLVNRLRQAESVDAARPDVFQNRLPPLPEWAVQRPTELAALVHALTRAGTESVAITTTLQGAGGFGKTLLASLACRSSELQRFFGREIYWITIGRETTASEQIASRVNELIELLTGERGGYLTVEAASQGLSKALRGRPRLLLVLDDVWEYDQVDPFMVGGGNCVRLITTRNAGIRNSRTVQINVDEMSHHQATELLKWELADLAPRLIPELLKATGRWPLLLLLVNRVLAATFDATSDVNVRAADLLARLKTGPQAIDLFRSEPQHLDLNDAKQRARAVQATMAASIELLGDGGADRFFDLGIFAEDENVPLHLVGDLWFELGGLDLPARQSLLQRMEQLALIELPEIGGRRYLRMHDVVRSYARFDLRRLGRFQGTNRALLAASSRTLPRLGHVPTLAMWWLLATDEDYLWDHLIQHLLDADLLRETGLLVMSPQWCAARRYSDGLNAVAGDLMRSGSPAADALRRELLRAAPLLGPTEPPHALEAILQSRLLDHEGPDRASDEEPRRSIPPLSNPSLINRWSLPDLASRRILARMSGARGQAEAIAIASDWEWLATAGSSDGSIVIWDVAVQGARAVILGHTAAVQALAVSTDGSLLVSAGDDGAIILWNTGTFELRSRIQVPQSRILAVAISSDASWFATAGTDHCIRLWETATGLQREVLVGHEDWIRDICISSDDQWIASAGDDRTVRLWDVLSGEQHHVLRGHEDWVKSVKISHDGEWIVSGSEDETIRVWDLRTGSLRVAPLRIGAEVDAIALDPEGKWAAIGGHFYGVRVLSTTTWADTNALHGQRSRLRSLAVSQARGLLGGGDADGTILVWDATAHDPEASTRLGARASPVDAVVANLANGRIAAAHADRAIRIWTADGEREHERLTGHTNEVTALVVRGEHELLSASSDGNVYLWDLSLSGQERGNWTYETLVPHINRIAHGHRLQDGRQTVPGSPGVTVWVSGTRGRDLYNWHKAEQHDDGPTQRSPLIAGPVRGLVPLPGQREVASCGDDGTVRILTPGSSRQMILVGHDEPVVAMASGGDGAWLASGDEAGELCVWNFDDSVVHRRPHAHAGAIRALVSSPLGLVSSGDDTLVRLWDPNGLTPPKDFSGHRTPVRALATLQDGRYVASGDEQGEIRIWDLRGETTCVTMMRVAGSVNQLAADGPVGLIVAGSGGLYCFELRLPE